MYCTTLPDSKLHGANVGPIWGGQDPGGPHVGPMNLIIWVTMITPLPASQLRGARPSAATVITALSNILFFLPQEFIIHTPCKDAEKMYIGNAMQGEVAAVFAQLYIDGESKGECRDPSLWNAKQDFNADFLISENDFLISKINFWYQKIIFWYQKISIKVLFGVPYISHTIHELILQIL